MKFNFQHLWLVVCAMLMVSCATLWAPRAADGQLLLEVQRTGNTPMVVVTARVPGVLVIASSETITKYSKPECVPDPLHVTTAVRCQAPGQVSIDTLGAVSAQVVDNRVFIPPIPVTAPAVK